MQELSEHFGWDLTRLTPPEDTELELGPARLSVILQHNPLHDAECIFWIVVYFVFNRLVLQANNKFVTRRPSDVEDIQKGVALDLMEDQERRNKLFDADVTYFSEDLDCLDPAMDSLKSLLLSLRTYLITGYKTAEEDMRNANWLTLADTATNNIQYKLVQAAYSLDKPESDIIVLPFRYSEPPENADQRPVNLRLRELSQAD